MNKKTLLFTLFIGSMGLLSAQSSTISTGGTLTGSGKADYSIGIPLYSPASGIGGTASSGNQQVYEISSTLGTDIQYIQLEMSVYPNPTTDKINIISDEIINQVKILSPDGKILLEKNYKLFNPTIDLSSLESGIYLMLITNDKSQTKTIKILKK